MDTLERYNQDAEGLAQEVVNAWGVNVLAGNGPLLTDEFKELLDKACRFRTVKDLAENHSEFGLLTDDEAAELKTSRREFAEAYRAFESRRLALGH